MSKFNKIRTNFVNRPIPKRGPFNSDEYNSGQQETAIDVATFATRWNEELYPIFNTLPKGQGDVRWPGASSVPDVLVEGLDGSTLLIDNDAPEVDSLEDLFWDRDLQRPRTIKEALFHVDADLAVKYSAISLQLSGVSNGLSSAQWNRLGRWVQDPNQPSAPESLDGRVIGLTDTIVSIHDDLGNVVEDLYTDGVVPEDRLTYTVQEMLSPLLTLHEGTWNADIGLSHIGINSWLGRTDDTETIPTYNSSNIIGLHDNVKTAIGKLDIECKQTETFVGKTIESSVHTYSSFNVIASPTTNHEVVLGALDGEFAFVWSFIGKGSRGAENRQFTENNYIADIDSLETAINKLDISLKDEYDRSWGEEGFINSFLGKTRGSNLPGYSSHNILVDGTNLEAAIGALDGESGNIKAYIGKSANGSTMPNYANNNIIDDGDSLTQSLNELDQEVGYILGFLHKTPGNFPPAYSSSVVVGPVDNIETAIGKLDNGLNAAQLNIVSLDGRLDAAEGNIVSLDSRLDAVELEIPTKAVRIEYNFSSHTNINIPIVWNHNRGILYPFVQVIDKGVGDYSGIIADEVYKYEQEHAISTSDAFVSVEFVNENTIEIYTSIVNGVIVGVF